MRNPYKQKRDFGRAGLIAVGVLALIVVALLALVVFRPGPSAKQEQAGQAFEAQMDQSEARYEAKRKADEAARTRSMQ